MGPLRASRDIPADEGHVTPVDQPLATRAPRRTARTLVLTFVAVTLVMSCAAPRSSVNLQQTQELATRYTAAWCSQDPARVAAFFVPDGSLKINDGAPSIGRDAITAAARGFMVAFPDLVVRMDSLSVDGRQAVYRWTLTGTNTAPGGTGQAVRISGYEEWTLSGDGLIERSLGHFDSASYDRQLQGTSAPGRR
jgi:uncharacterized protein (TIGR02246 family)